MSAEPTTNPDERNPDHPVTAALRNQWHTLLAIAMWKLRQREILVTTDDLAAFGKEWPPGCSVIAADTATGLFLRLSTPEETQAALEKERAKQLAAIPPVDRSKRTLLDGSPVTANHREIDPKTGMQNDYVVLSADERAKGFVRPLRRTYIHYEKCGASTTMGQAIAETYARDPGFYSGTFCIKCREHFPVREFRWEDGQVVGS